MAIHGTTTLIQFEAERQRLKFVPYINDISDVGEGKVEIITVRGLPTNPRFDMIVRNKHLDVGDGDFSIVGDRMDPNNVYRYLTIAELANLTVSRQLIVTGDENRDPTDVPGKIIVNGNLKILGGGSLVINHGGIVEVPHGGTLYLSDLSSLNIFGGKLIVKGSIYLPTAMIDEVFSNIHVELYPSAIIKVTELPGARVYSLTDYIAELNSVHQSLDASSARSMSAGAAQASYRCIVSDDELRAHILDINIDRGDVILGDFTLRVTGQPIDLQEQSRSIRSLTVNAGSRLILSNKFMGDNYLQPKLIISKSNSVGTSGIVTVDGELVVTNGDISLDCGGEIIINENGKLIVEGSGRLHHLDDSSVVTINGQLIVDNIRQLGAIEPVNYRFGPEGKLIVLNPSPMYEWERSTLFSIPLGLKTSELIRLFGDRLELVEYHLSRHTGIEIDTDMTPFHLWSDWYNGVRLELAIANGWLVWHDEAFISADRSTLPWLEVKRGLGQVTKLFKSYKATERDRLQSLADRLSHAGSGNMIFRFTDKVNSLVAETTLTLDKCELLTASYNPLAGTYGITATSEGELYLVSPPSGTEAESIVTPAAKVETVPSTHRTTFRLP